MKKKKQLLEESKFSKTCNFLNPIDQDKINFNPLDFFDSFFSKMKKTVLFVQNIGEENFLVT